MSRGSGFFCIYVPSGVVAHQVCGDENQIVPDNSEQCRAEYQSPSARRVVRLETVGSGEAGRRNVPLFAQRYLNAGTRQGKGDLPSGFGQRYSSCSKEDINHSSNAHALLHTISGS